MTIKKIYQINDLEWYRYEPSIFHPFYIEMEPTTIMRRIRFLIDYCYGYAVYYLKKGSEWIGYCTITNGKNPRFWFATDSDIVIGPYFIDEQFRGNGYSEIMVREVYITPISLV